MTPVSSDDRPARSTIRDVARLAGVGIKTVSRVINAEPNVSPATAERVRRAVAALDYIPDRAAGNLKRIDKSSRTLGLLVADTTDPFFAQVNRAVEDYATSRDYAVFTSSSDEEETKERRAIDAFLQRRVDGLILACTPSNKPDLAREMARGTPVVFLDRLPNGVVGDAVVTDNAAAASRAVQHLARHGHRRIAGIFDGDDIWTAAERERGYLEASARAALEPRAPVRLEEADEASAVAAVTQLLRSAEPPTALFTGRGSISIGAVRALQHIGKQHEVALVGFDDFTTADLLDPAISVVAQRPSHMGLLAAELLFKRLDGESGRARTVVVPSDLVARGSGEIPGPGTP